MFDSPRQQLPPAVFLAPIVAATVGQGEIQLSDSVVDGANGVRFVAAEIMLCGFQVRARIPQGGDRRRNSRMQGAFVLRGQRPGSSAE